MTKELLGLSEQQNGTKYDLCLYVAGMSPRSQKAIRNIRSICEEELMGRYVLEVIDIYQQPELAQEEQIVAVPTLIRKQPLPPRKLVGDMSDRDKVLTGLEIPQPTAPGKEGSER